MASASDGPYLKVAGSVLLLLLGIVLGMFGFWLRDQQDDIEYNRDVALSNATRLTALENRQAAVIDEIYRRLGVIEREIGN